MDLKQGHYIVVEGLEGAGKSTAISTIKKHLISVMPEFITTREPGGTDVGEVIRDLIKKENIEEPMDARAELLLLYAARIQLLECVIKPALKRGCWVLADRNELSTFAYQGGGRKIDGDFIGQLSKFSMQGLQPDLIIFLDISPSKGLQRAKMRGTFDRIEQEPLSFFQEVHNRYHEKIKTLDNVVIIDACKPLKAVQQDIKLELDRYLKQYAITN